MTRYLFQRMAHNDRGWLGPSPGRFDSKVDGGYIQEHGFAGEDWNFAVGDQAEGNIFGYSAYVPRDRDGDFSIILAVYDRLGGWSVVGLYEGAVVDLEGLRLPKDVIDRRARELYQLRAHFGPEWNTASLSKMRKMATSLHAESPWRVPVAGVTRLSIPVPVSLSFIPGSHFRTAKALSAEQFDEVIEQVRHADFLEPQDDYSEGGDTEFPEGKKAQSSHFKRERSVSLVKAAKSIFKKRHGRLFCEGCNFSFSNTYGAVGEDFIEAHHIIPVHTLTDESVTRIEDLMMVCSNCHRMLHRRRPCMGKAELQSLVRQMAG